MNLRRLKYFVKIVDIGSLTQAAEVLHIAQPALSQQVATLEGELDQQLLIRSKRGVTPTEAGKVLYGHARTILRQCEQAQLAVNNLGRTLTGRVTLGLTSGAACSAFTLPLLQAVRKELPDVNIHLYEHSGAALNQRLASGQLDFAVMYERAPATGVISQPLLKEDLYLVGSKACPGQHVDLSTVANSALVLPRDYSEVRRRIDEAFTLRRLQATIIGEIESLATLQAALISGMGMTVLPESAAREMVSAIGGWMAKIASPGLSVPVMLCTPARCGLTPQAQAVKDILLAQITRPLQDDRALMLAS